MEKRRHRKANVIHNKMKRKVMFKVAPLGDMIEKKAKITTENPILEDRFIDAGRCLYGSAILVFLGFV